MVRVLKKVAIAVGVITTKIGGSAVDDGFRRAVSGDDVAAECVFSFFDYDGDDEVVVGNGVDNGSDFSDGSDNEDNSNCGGDDVLVMTMTKTMTTTKTTMTTKTKTTTTKMTMMKKTLTRQ